MLNRISVKRLKVGLHVYLKDVPWFKHPFFRSNFKIKKQVEIYEIQSIGCEYVYFDPALSDCPPLEEDAEVRPVQKNKEAASIKKERSTALRKRKEAFLKTEKDFFASAKQANKIMQGILNGQMSFGDKAEQMAHDFACLFLDDVETTLNLINISGSDDEVLYYHSLNVSILSCMLGKELGITVAEMKDLAFGALMHDIGKAKIHKKIVYKQSSLSKAESNLLKMHPLYGVGLLSGMKSVTKGVMKTVYHHHISNGGMGYPAGIEFEKLTLLPKIVAVTDLYDNIINNRDSTKAFTPHQALASMYKVHAKKLDENILSHFIRMLGVYPPGSICELDTGELAMVVSIGSNPLLPEVVLCDLNVPKSEAMILKLGTDIDSKVERVLSSKDLSGEQLRYLSPKAKIGYYAESKKIV